MLLCLYCFLLWLQLFHQINRRCRRIAVRQFSCSLLPFDSIFSGVATSLSISVANRSPLNSFCKIIRAAPAACNASAFFR